MNTMLVMPEAFAGRISKRGDPTWEIAGFFPRQGEWSEEEYLRLSATQAVELNDGCLEVLAMPGFLHQAIVGYIYELLTRFVRENKLGMALMAPFPVRLWSGQYREPDLVFLKPDRIASLRSRDPNGQADGADLVMEVLSPGDENRHRDLVVKREIYARAQISEYWIVDPEKRTITVLSLEGALYRVHGDFSREQRASSVLLNGFEVDVGAVFAAIE